MTEAVGAHGPAWRCINRDVPLHRAPNRSCRQKFSSSPARSAPARTTRGSPRSPAKELALAGADVTRISLDDYPMPIYDGDLEAQSGPPANAAKLKQLMAAHHGVFIASPEYNASITPLLKNTIDWISRVRERGEPPLAVFKNRVFALGGASDGAYGAMRSLLALRQVLELGCGALVIPEQIAVMRASEAFDDMDNLKRGARGRAAPARVAAADRNGAGASLMELARSLDRRARSAVGGRRRGDGADGSAMPCRSTRSAISSPSPAGSRSPRRWSAPTSRCSSISSCMTSATRWPRASRASPGSARPSSPCTPIRRPCMPRSRRAPAQACAFSRSPC